MIRKDNLDGVMLHSRSRYQDFGEKKTSNYFLNLKSRHFTGKVTNKLVDDDGLKYTNAQDILNCQNNFYETLSKEDNNTDENP